MILPTLDKELELFGAGYDYIVGIDEVGRGPWAGPVVAGAVVIKPDIKLLDLVRDSKKLSEKQRENVYEDILSSVEGYGIGEVSNNDIDSLGLLEATRAAMHSAFDSAISALPGGRIYGLVDGYFKDGLGIEVEHLCVNRGDESHYSVAAASIIAKVYRDRLMSDLDKKYPEYGFADHKGYGTKKHIQALGTYGICEIHRKSFKPVAKFVI